MANVHLFFEEEFNPDIYDRALFEYELQPKPGGRFLVDAPIITRAIEFVYSHSSNNRIGFDEHQGYYRKRHRHDYIEKEKFPPYYVRSFLKSMPVRIAAPTLAELYGMRMPETYRGRTWELLNRENVTLLVDCRLSYDYWENFLRPYAPVLVQNLKSHIHKGLSRNDAILIALSQVLKDKLLTFDKFMIEVACKYDTPVYDTRIERHLPTLPSRTQSSNGQLQNQQQKFPVNQSER